MYFVHCRKHDCLLGNVYIGFDGYRCVSDGFPDVELDHFLGVAGYLSLWGADLDPTTVVNILVG